MNSTGSPLEEAYSSIDQRALHRNLEDAICLLALITSRHSGFEQLLLPVESSNNGSGSLGLPAEKDHVSASHADTDSLQEDDISDWGEDEEVLSTMDVIQDEQQNHLELLHSKVLDRLAEALARFKTDRSDKTNRDAKHVASTMMLIDQERRRTKIICAKNEGLDKLDEAFLDEWKTCMEAISSTGEGYSRYDSMSIPLIADRDRYGKS